VGHQRDAVRVQKIMQGLQGLVDASARACPRSGCGRNELIETVPLDDLPPAPSPEEVERRADLCRSCPHYRAGNDQCAMCGCAFVIAERTRSRVARCPEGRWS